VTAPIPVSAEDARRLVLHLQGLGESHRRPLDDETLLDLIRRMGFVQVDSINTVERAHHMILASRATGYRKPRLARLLERRRDLFENWTHDASIIPSDYFPYWMRRFENRRRRLADGYTRWHGPEFLTETEKVLRHIEANGPVLSRDLSPEERKGPGAWWNWHPSKTALEFLWRVGDLAICRREGFQKVYDLTHRVIPEPHRETPAEHAALVNWACRSALERLGFGTAGEIAGFWDHITTEEAKAWCEANLGGAVALASVQQVEGRPRALYARPDLEDALAKADPPPNALRVLNPFDPVLRDRKRLKGLFGFDYRIEVFVPAPKRTYGYYVFPILEGDRLIGRIDMKARRDEDVLSVTGLWAEPGIDFGKGRTARLERELDRQRRFAGVSDLRFEDGWKRS
jgi:uncharacterized protein YcaQ